tara:strand:- start:726 stop:1514 length:789 start_codon:yes stop_codon:yes gene_type:complete
MPSIENQAPSSWWRKILQIGNAGNLGASPTATVVQDGTGVNTSLKLGTNGIDLQPNTADGRVLRCLDKSGTAKLTVDSSASTVTAGSFNVITMIKEFGIYDLSPTAGYHYPLVANNMFIPASATAFDADNDWGNGTDPATTLDVSGLTQQENAVAVYWIVPAAITLDSVTGLVACDDSDAATINLHLMSYTLDTSSNHGDLSDGTVHASGSTTCTNAQIKKVLCTLDSASISANKVVIAFVENATDTDDVSVSIQARYHINI